MPAAARAGAVQAEPSQRRVNTPAAGRHGAAIARESAPAVPAAADDAVSPPPIPGSGFDKKQLAARFVAGTRTRALLARMLPREGVLILNYHRIGDGSASPHDRAVWSATEEDFDAQLAFLKDNCDVIALDDLEHALTARGRHVAITFDDGYLDNYQSAFAALRRHRLPAAFFVTTGFIDRPRLPWWDEIADRVRGHADGPLDMGEWLPHPLRLDAGNREAAIHTLLRRYKSLPISATRPFMQCLRERTASDADAGSSGMWMDWTMLREMAEAGMTIGGHSVNHPILSSLPAQAQHEEIAGCARRIEQEIGRPMRYFAYPVGGRATFDADTWRALDEAGVRRAFSYYGGMATRASERFDTQRVAIEAYMDADLFRAMVQLPQVFCRRPNE